MRMTFRAASIAALYALIAAHTPAHAQVVRYMNPDGYNNTPVSVANPLPVTGSIGGSASVGTNGAASPGSTDQIGSVDGSGNLQPASSTNPIPTTVIGGATAVNQTTANTSLATIAGAVGSAQPAACTSVKPISQTSSTDLLTAVAKIQICSIVLVAPDAESISLVQGTGSTCATGIAALIGGTTAANGIALAANGGFTATSSAPWLVMTTTAQHLCLLQSGSGRVAGVITYVDK